MVRKNASTTRKNLTQYGDQKLETKVVSPKNSADVNVVFDDFMNAFEEFKQTNDTRLDALEKHSVSDPLTEQKLGKISAHLDRQQSKIDLLSQKAKRPILGGEMLSGFEDGEAKAAFNAYMRQGMSQIETIEGKAYSLVSGNDGGYFVPEQIESNILDNMKLASPIRDIAGIQQVTSAIYKKPFAINEFASGWVGDADARPQTNGADLEELVYPTMELYAMPAASASLLEDSAVNLEEWIAAEIEAAFIDQETEAFVNGDGVNKPKGFLDVPTAAEASWSWGNLGYIETGADGAFAASDASDCLLDLIYSLKARYRMNGNWVMNRKTQAEIRKLKDADGNYMWRPAEVVNGKASLLNYSIAEVEQMPDMAADSMSLAFGDFGRGYLIVDRRGISILRDPYSAKPYLLFYTTKRVGGGVHDFNAIKLLKFAA
ncbi:MAG: phage major capsid protein [Hyphomicrobiales bacterium]|nr:MAG: phage major capsid protein [Hyphomicrobiales bacterium]